MICPSCYAAQSRVGKTVDLRDTIIRTHKCPACGASWATEETLRKGSLATGGQIRPLAVANSHGRPPPAVKQPPVATDGQRGVGGALPSGSDPGPIPSPDPSQQTHQDLPRAREGSLWTVYDWRRKYGMVWCDKYGGTAIGGDGEADGKLRDLLESLPAEARLAAQARAPQMFREFLAEDGEPAKARHRWSWFVGRFESLRVPMAKPARAAAGGGFALGDL